MDSHAEPAADNEYDIAIVGISCRFPGAKNTDEFWQNLANGVESITRLSDQEILDSGVPLSQLQSPNYVKAAPVLDEPGLFDAAFFGYSPMEARTMDPQHRLLLELAYETLEDAGCDPDRYSGRIGVFAGSAMNTYFMQSGLSSRFAEEYIPTLIANDKDFLSTRISYKLNLKGPSVTIQTACSTSLVAVHLARQSLLSGETDMALAGAVSVRVPHRAGYFCDGGGIVSPDGHVRAFDSRANGTVFGSGGGVLALKRLADAISDGDTIYAVIKGSAVNNDGSQKAGYTAPSVNSQADAVVEALANAGVGADAISYIEAHGSGTPVGDPIEVLALTKAFRTQTQRSGYCAIGSVKTNLGHLDAAAGMAGIIKTALALKHRMLPPSLNYDEPNPEIAFTTTPFFVNTKLAPWGNGNRLRAGVMATGMGGTNAHLVMEEAPGSEERTGSDLPNLLILSARTKTALDHASERLLGALQADASMRMDDVAYTLQTGRKQYPHRRFLVCRDRADAIAALEQKDSKRLVSSVVEDTATRPVLLLLPGIGDHYVGMAFELYEKWDVFREEIDCCARILEPLLGRDIRAVIYPKDNKWRNEANRQGIDIKKMLGRKTDETEDPASRLLNETIHVQPALFTIEYALARLWQHFGINPAAIVGHSMGEYVAGCLADVFSLEDALRLIAVRARLVSGLPKGAMLAVTLAEDEVTPLLGPELSISLINGPSLCVVAGPAQAIDDFEKVCTNKGILCRPVKNAHAFHSRMLDPIVPAFEAEVRKVQLSEPKIPYISNLTGTWISKAEATDPFYWARHANHPARFNDALHHMWQIKNAILLEAGPGNTLGVLATQHPDRKNAENVLTVSSLRAHYDHQSDCEFLLHSMGKLWLAGRVIDWKPYSIACRAGRSSLPTYPFERQNHWTQQAVVPYASHSAGVSVQKNPKISDWFYVPSWKRMMPRTVNSCQLSELLSERHVWLVFADEDAATSRAIARLKSSSQEVITVRAGGDFRRVDSSTFIIEAGNSRHYELLVGALLVENLAPSKVLHAWSLAGSHDRRPEADPFKCAQEKGFYSVLFFVKALARQKLSNPLKLFILSNQIQDVNGREHLHPEKATVLGPCMVIPQEFPSIHTKSIDMELPEGRSPVDQMTDCLLGEILADDSEMFVAYRNGQRWVQTYEPVQINDRADGSSAFREGGVYLITGGLGDIGYVIAKHLAEQYKAKLVLTGRSELPVREEWNNHVHCESADQEVTKRISRIRDMEALGAEVAYFNADVADFDRMQGVIKSAHKAFGRIDGVIHGAGIVGSKGIREIVEINSVICDLHFKAKAYGLNVLERVLDGQKLDFCMLLSSLTPILGGIGEVAYSSSNVFMDLFAHKHNREQQTPWISVNWDLWRLETKPGSNVRMGKTLEDLGISAEEGMKVLELVVQIKEVPQIVASTGDLNARIKQWIKLTSLREGPSEKQPPRGEADGADLPMVRSRYRDAADETERAIALIWQDVLGIKQVGIDDNFADLGGHSLLAIKIVSKMRKAFDVDLPIRALFEAPTVAQMAARLRDKESAAKMPGRLAVIQEGSSGKPLFFVHGISGEHFYNRPLIRHLNIDRPIYGLRLPESNGKPKGFPDLRVMARFHVESICSVQPEGPYYLAGYSYGGRVALEIAQQLAAEGKQVALLAMIEAGPSSDSARSFSERCQMGWYFLRNLPFYVVYDLVQSDPKAILLGIRRKGARVKKRTLHLLKTGRYPTGKIDLEDIFEAPAHHEPLWEAQEVNYRAWVEYKALPYPGRVTLFRAYSSPLFHYLEPDYGWSRFALGGLDVKRIPGNHESIMREPHVRQLAIVFRASILDAGRRSSQDSNGVSDR
jgi:acyl transferase domain-containing protein/thioesterase domain-containing protein/acyl carrier protein